MRILSTIFQKPEAGRAEWIIRGCQKRNLTEKLADTAGSEYKKLYAEVESTRILGQVGREREEDKSFYPPGLFSS